MALIFKNGLVVNAGTSIKTDVRVEGEKITALGLIPVTSQDQVIDISGRYLLPGFVDPHVHFDLNIGICHTIDDFYSGSKAALAGGVTTIIDFTNHTKGESLQKQLDDYHKRAKDKTFCDYGFHLTLSEWNDTLKKELISLSKEGYSSCKMYMAYPDRLMVTDRAIFEALKTAGEHDILMAFHCENGELIEALIEQEVQQGHHSAVYHAKSRPASAEAMAVERLLALAKEAGSAVYIVHLSSKKALKALCHGRNNGVQAYAETCPQYLFLDESRYQKDHEGRWVISPPLRQEKDTMALKKAMSNGIFDVISTDHCSFSLAQKAFGQGLFNKTPNGMSGVQRRFELLYSHGVRQNLLSMEDLVNLCSFRPAKLFGLTQRKGAIDIGYDADLVIFNPAGEETISLHNSLSASDYEPYEGFTRYGSIEQVYLRGSLVFNQGKLTKEKPQGQFLRRSLHKGENID